MEGCETLARHTTKSCMYYFFYYFLYFLRCIIILLKNMVPFPTRKFKDTLAPSIISYFLTIVILVNIFWIHSRVLEACEPSQFAILRCRQKNLLLYVLLWRLFVWKILDIFWLSKPYLNHIVTFFKKPHVQIHPLMVIIIDILPILVNTFILWKLYLINIYANLFFK